MLNKEEIKRYHEDGYIIPEFKMPENELLEIEKLHDELKIPIGIINSSVGGTPAEAWSNIRNLRPPDLSVRPVRLHRD